MRTYETSRAMIAEARSVLAGGVASTLRASMKPTPLYVKSASGVTVTDVDGNEYIDYLLAYGPLILGHAHPVFNEKVAEAMSKGITYGLQHEGEIRLARRLTEVLPCADKVALSGSGTEAVMLALRLARAYTGKQKIVRFHGHYHGWSDSIYTSFPAPDLAQLAAGGSEGGVAPGTKGQSELSLKDIILVKWNDPEALETTLRKHAGEIAAVITEPVMCNSGCILPLPGYLEKMRSLTEELGIVLIFDEVITGFRLSIGGAHGRFGITPDLVTVGKALGGGIALSAVGGKREILGLIDSEQVGHLGTLNGNCVALAAGLAVLDILSADNGAVYTKMENLAIQLAEGLRSLFAKHGIGGIVNQIGPVFNVMFTDVPEVRDFDTFQKRNAGQYARFAERMLDEGVLVRPNGLWYLSAVHEEEHIAKTLEAADRVLAGMKEGK